MNFEFITLTLQINLHVGEDSEDEEGPEGGELLSSVRSFTMCVICIYCLVVYIHSPCALVLS